MRTVSRRRRVWGYVERAVLGAMMALAAFIIDRRMRKILARMQETQPSHSATFGPDDI